ncbi:MAG: septum formation protein Maf [Bacteroidales bacterium]|nr:septum formation protein Maf [Bacteroidales bacterium]
MEIFNKKILLNSRSPRRKQILTQLGFDVQTVVSHCEETYSPNLSPEEVAVYLATKKGQAYSGKIAENEVLVSADTIVVAGNTILGKPKDENDAFNMLKNLSNSAHKVITGCFIKDNSSFKQFFETTQVVFSALTDEEIRYYISKYSPLDKAGAYGIQEWVGMIGISEIKGDYYNVMGLPAHKLWQHLHALKK